ncbi:acetylxylan esterase [bacterium]|nr:acetylxylan esterase [bacterium]MDB4807742.1 acetylxylan esterase [bacterium]
MRYVMILGALLIVSSWGFAVEPTAGDGDRLAKIYFANQTAEITNQTFAEINSLSDWTDRRDQYQDQLLEMLGLDPFPERTPLNARITGSVENNGVIAERIHFQSRPGLYVTGNFYRPVKQDTPLPAILYVCGHGRVKRDGISLGNKTHYQHHGAWFARNGYVCLTIDTIQLGEIEGIHHGTYREKMWWWNNRGYTPAGVEAWNCVRALDYLQSRDEVDSERIGVTGRSGGGAYSWWIAAIDERIKVAVPVAGITSLKNHVVDGCVEGHCDCMYMVNTYRWDYPMVAALVAPRPLLISNTDKDRIFPLDGVVDVYTRTKKIYQLYDADDKLGLHITEGPHQDTQELRVHAFRWFNHYLRNDDSLITSAATPLFDQKDLKVFPELPSDENVTSIHETFVPAVGTDDLPTDIALARKLDETTTRLIRQKCFGGWPATGEKTNVKLIAEASRANTSVRVIDFTSQDPYRLRIYLVGPEETKPGSLTLHVLDKTEWAATLSGLANLIPDHTFDVRPDANQWETIAALAKSETIAYVAPRGIGPTEWSDEAKKRTQIRRRFMQLGQTAAGMQTYDILRATLALQDFLETPDLQVSLEARNEGASWALFASLFMTNVKSLTLTDLSPRNRDAPDLLNISRLAEPPQIVLMQAARGRKLQIRNRSEWGRQWSELLTGNQLAEQAVRLQSSTPDSE